MGMKILKKMPGACVLCALQYCSGADEELILRQCAARGFKIGEGMLDSDWLPVAKELGLKLIRKRMEPMVLKKFCREFPKGLYLVSTSGHLLVVDHGIIVDPRMNTPGLRRMVLEAWQVKRHKLMEHISC